MNGYPACGELGERKTHTLRGSTNSWLFSGTVEDIQQANTIIDVEGVTDLLAVTSAGLPDGWVAVTNTAGAKARGKLHRPWARGKRVIDAGDADEPGHLGQRHAAIAYHEAGAAKISLAQLPYPIEKDHGRDCRDWLNDGHKIEELPTVALRPEEAAQWSEAETSGIGRPRINAANQNLEQVTAEAWDALVAANQPERLFRYSGRPSRIENGDDGEPILRNLDQDRARYELARCAEWYKIVGEDGEEVPASPPKDVVRDVLAQPDMPLPVLARIVEAPVYAADGTLQTVSGYHSAGRTYYAPAAGFTVPDVPEQPTQHNIDVARRLVCDDMLGDFPFIGATELAHAVSMFLLPFVREIIGSGSTPIHLFEKPSPGTGATLLVDCLAHAAIGRPVPTMTECKDEDELRKRLTSKFLVGSQYMFFDNLGCRLDSPTLSAAVTAPIWEDRRLGFSEVVRVPVRCIWIASGNNPSVSNEISRRSIRIRLDARIDRPWLREGFRIPNLRLLYNRRIFGKVESEASSR